MAIVTGLGTSWNLPNYAGELFTADPQATPLLSMIGGMTGGVMTTNVEFPTNQLFSYPTAQQPEISEQASAVAPTARHIDRTQQTNVCQIHQNKVDITYHKLANTGRMTGLNTAGQTPSPADELAWQITHSMLIPAARDIEYSFINGTYQKSTGVNVPNKTRGMIELTKSGGINIAVAGASLSFGMLQELYRGMADNGAVFNNLAMFVTADLKQAISKIYAELPGGNLPATRNEGGINITDIETDFGKVSVIWNRFMKDGELLLCDIAYMQPVFLEVPGKGVMFVEELAKVGASEPRQMYGEVGLDHGPAFLHGSITGLGV